MKKIVLVSNTSWSMIKFRYSLMKTLLNNNYEVYVLAPKDEYSKQIEELGCKYIDIKIDNKGSNPLKDLKLIFDFYGIYKKINPNLIIHYTIKPNIYGTIASKLINIKSFAVVTGLGYTFINNNLVSKIAKLLYQFAFQYSSKVFFINQDDINEFITKNLVSKNKIFLLPGEGITINIFIPMKNEKKDNKFRFLLIARMLKDKGVYEYIEAGKILSKKYNNFEIGLLGYLGVNNPHAISKEQMDLFVKEDYITYYGFTSDVKPYIANSDCIVLPSYREGLSMTLMESASMAKPLITTNVPGCKDVVDDGINGYLCEVKNSWDLANKMEKMLNLSEEERLEMGKKGREKIIKEFDEKIVINKYLEVIKELS